MDLKFVRTDLVQLISDCVSNFKNVDPEREFIFIPPVEKLEISIDPIRIEQVLANLLENACRYSTAKQKIEIKLEQFPGRVMVSVSDSGPGISKEQQEPHVEAIESLGAWIERANPTFICINVPPEASYAKVRQYLEQQEASAALEYETCEARVAGSFDDAPEEGVSSNVV